MQQFVGVIVKAAKYVLRREALIILVSAVTFIFALTQVAYITLPPYAAGDEVVAPVVGYALENFLTGWLLVPFAIFHMFAPDPLAGAMVVSAVSLMIFGRRFLALIVGGSALLLLTWNATLCLASWLANPLLFASWYVLYRGRWRQSFYLSLIAIGLMLEFLTAPGVPYGLNQANVPIQAYGVGYWAWIASSLIVIFTVSPALCRSLLHKLSQMVQAL